jgi:hypothetical protein
MSLGFIYYFLLLCWILFNGVVFWSPAASPYAWRGNGVLLFVLFLLIGFQIFGSPIHG